MPIMLCALQASKGCIVGQGTDKVCGYTGDRHCPVMRPKSRSSQKQTLPSARPQLLSTVSCA